MKSKQSFSFRLCLSIMSLSSASFLSGCNSEEAPASLMAAVSVAPQNIKKIVMIVLENTPFEDAMKQPFLNALSKKGALLTHYSAITHPSQPNYVALISGSTDGVAGNAPASLAGKHIGDLLIADGKDWRVYAEGYPGSCFLGAVKGKYARKHVPFLSFKSVQNNFDQCSRIVNASQFEKDFNDNALPEYSLYIPDLDNDGHDTGVAFADRWLSQSFSRLFQNSERLLDTLFVITFDEGIARDNRVYTLFYGAGVKSGVTSSVSYNHYSLLLTTERLLGLPNLGNGDVNAVLIDDIWNGSF